MAIPRVFLSGIGGYAANYITALLNPKPGSLPFKFVAAADPVAEKNPAYQALKDAGVEIYHDASEFFDHDTCDLCIVSSPIQFHLEQTRLAMSRGAHVLCEKPIGATLEQAREMLDLESQYGRKIMIGFQWSYAEGMLALKRDILAGRFGRPLELRSMINWPRGAKYYARPWAAKLYDEAGRPVFDSIANNACAHYIHNMLFLLGERMELSATPESVSAQLYRANPIQNFDTAFVEIHADGAKLIFAASHAGSRNSQPAIDYQFERARITLVGNSEDAFELHAHTPDGDIVYPMHSTHQDKFYAALHALRGEPQPCTVRTALPHMQCIDALGRMPITTITPDYIDQLELSPGDRFNVARGMDGLLNSALATGELPHAGDAPYVTPTSTAAVTPV